MRTKSVSILLNLQCGAIINLATMLVGLLTAANLRKISQPNSHYVLICCLPGNGLHHSTGGASYYTVRHRTASAGFAAGWRRYVLPQLCGLSSYGYSCACSHSFTSAFLCLLLLLSDYQACDELNCYVHSRQLVERDLRVGRGRLRHVDDSQSSPPAAAAACATAAAAAAAAVAHVAPAAASCHAHRHHCQHRRSSPS